MLLVYPPISRPSEAPPGIARLAASARARGIPVDCLDLNLACLLDAVGREEGPAGTASLSGGARAAWRRRRRNLSLLRSPEGYKNFSVYSRSVFELEIAYSLGLGETGAGLADFRLGSFDPHRSEDLLAASRDPEASPFFFSFKPRLDAALREGRHELAGVSLCYLSQVQAACAILGYLRREYPDLRLVLGGSLITSWLSSEGGAKALGDLADDVVGGEGEDWLEAAFGPLPSGGIQGASPWMADYSDFRAEAYLAPGRILPFGFSSGCAWARCRFCPEKAEGRPYRQASLAEAMAGVSRLIREEEPILLHFVDSEIPQSILKALADSGPGRPWYGFARFSRLLEDPSFCRALADAGCAMLQLGLESASERVLKAMGKGTSLNTSPRILANLKGAGIGTYVYVLFGSPWEGPEDAGLTRDFIADHAELIDFLNIALFNMPAGIPEALELAEPGADRGDLSLYLPLRHPLGWGREAVRRFIAEDIEDHPRIRPILRRAPPLFTSSHAAFFLQPDRNSRA
jgi:hypothetical protein